MSTADNPESYELIVGPDGSIPADQISRLGLHAGSHLRVVQEPAPEHKQRFGGSLPDLADVTWEDFERGSDLARSDLRLS
jgi:hypothetical protein